METFRKTKEYKQWTLKISKEVDDNFESFIAEYGKLNKTGLVEHLLTEYIKKMKNKDVSQ